MSSRIFYGEAQRSTHPAGGIETIEAITDNNTNEEIVAKSVEVDSQLNAKFELSWTP